MSEDSIYQKGQHKHSRTPRRHQTKNDVGWTKEWNAISHLEQCIECGGRSCFATAKKWHVGTAYIFSKKLNPIQTRYSTFGRKLPADHLTITHFWHMVESLNFTAYMHHKPPTKALIAKQDNYSPKEIRQVQFISHLTYDILKAKKTK